MPDFGKFHTILPLADNDARTVYLAQRRDGSDQHKYVVVVFRVRKATEEYERGDEGIRNLGQDLQLAFISAIKAQKRATDFGSQFVAPIYEVGINSEGAWYATDYFPRGSLQDWMQKPRAVDERSLRRVLALTIAGLQDLKRLSGRSHGDLSLSKMLLRGKSSSLLKAQLQITEPLAGSEADAEFFERADVRALGAVLYQLVSGKEVRTTDEITYPVAPTHQWARLGEEGDYWLRLCNKLLANPPQHSLDSLARELPPPKPTPKWKLYAAAALVIFVLIGTWLRFSPRFLLPTDTLKHVAAATGNGKATKYLETKAEYLNAIEQARQQADWGEFEDARDWLTNALALNFRHAEAQRVLQEILSRETRFHQYLIAIPQLLAQTRYSDALQACAQVRRVAPKSARIDQWETKASQAEDALQDFKEGRYAVAERKFDHIWQGNLQDLTLKEMRDRSSACAENWAMFDRTKQTNFLEVVLSHNPADSRAKAELNRAPATEGTYLEHLEDARALFDGGDYAAATREFEWAVSARPDADSKSRLEESKALQRLREKADTSYAEKQWEAAETNYAEIFRRNPKDAGAEARLKECQRAPGRQL